VRGWLALLLVIVGFSFATPRVQADSLSVYVGYADTLRAGGFVPGPFCSTFGPACQVQQGVALDSGVFQIDNIGSTAVTITGVTVTLNPTNDPVTFALWSSVTILAGGAAIFGQTDNSDPDLSNFDTSDYPLVQSTAGINVNGIGGCTTLSALSASQQATCVANFPIISFDENGDPVTIVDSGSILNHGSYDFSPPPGSSSGNESINWNLAGTVSTTPEPTSIVLLGTGLLSLLGVMRSKS
jgi:hypothetical protein